MLFLIIKVNIKMINRFLQVAKKHKNWSLASLAVRVRLDAFTKIKDQGEPLV